MTNELQLLAQKRGRLLERIAHQRGTLSAQFVPVQRAVDKADRAVATARSFWQYVRIHRAAIVLIAGAVGSVFVLVKPRRSLRLLRRGFVLWRSWRAMQSMGVFVPSSLWATAFNTIRQRYF